MLDNIISNKFKEGVSPVVGVILIVAIVIILAALVGAIMFGFTDQLDGDSSNAAFELNEQSGTITPIQAENGTEYDLIVDDSKTKTIPGNSVGKAIQIDNASAGSTIQIVNPQTGQVVQEWEIDDETNIGNGGGNNGGNNGFKTYVVSKDSEFQEGVFTQTELGSVILSSKQQPRQEWSKNYEGSTVKMGDYLYTMSNNKIYKTHTNGTLVNDKTLTPQGSDRNVLAHNSNVYALSELGNLTVLDSNLNTIDEAILNGSIDIEIGNGRLYSFDETKVYSYYISNITLASSYSVGAGNSDEEINEIEFYNDNLYIGTTINLYKTDPTNGQKLWSIGRETYALDGLVAVGPSGVYEFSSSGSITDDIGGNPNYNVNRGDELVVVSDGYLINGEKINSSGESVWDVISGSPVPQPAYDGRYYYAGSEGLKKWDTQDLTTIYEEQGTWYSEEFSESSKFQSGRINITVTDFNPNDGESFVFGAVVKNESIDISNLNRENVSFTNVNSVNSDNKYTFDTSDLIGNYTRMIVQLKDSDKDSTPKVQRVEFTVNTSYSGE